MITTWSRGDADDNMPEHMLVDLLGSVAKHPWWRARAKLAVALLQKNKIQAPSEILDAGCGWGTNLTALESAGYRVTGLDISRRVLEKIDSPQRRLVEADLFKQLPEDAAQFEALLALDVIEHIDDDAAVVGRLAQLLKPGGLAIISVPALPELYSHFDKIQGHRRRYTPETLRAAFNTSGLTVNSLFYWGRWMVPVLRWTRLKETSKPGASEKTYADYLRLPRWPLPLLMSTAYALELKPALEGTLSTGTSLFAVATRR